MSQLSITYNGTTENFEQSDLTSPKFDSNCFTPETYVERVVERGILTVTDNGDGTFTYRRISPHCICNVEFTVDC